MFRSLEKNGERARQLLTWIQDSITTGQLRDPGVPGVKWFNTFLKKDRFLPETGKPLLPRYLRKLGAVFAVVTHGAKNLSEAMTIASQALRHSPDNHASPAQNYTIVNYRLRENLMIRQRQSSSSMKTNHISGSEGILEGSDWEN